MRNAMVMPVVLVVTLLISMLIGTYMMSTSVQISNEYHRDLAEVRGYWGAYGAKELNSSDIIYQYSNYDINVTKNDSNYTWVLNIPSTKSSGITNDDLYNRSLIVLDANSSDANGTNIRQYQ